MNVFFFREMSNLVNKLTKTNNAFCYIGAELKKLKNLYGKNLYTVSKLFNWSDTVSFKYNKEYNFDIIFKSRNKIFQKFAVSHRFEINSEYYYRNSFREKRHVVYGLEGSQSCYLLQGIYYNNTNWSDEEVIAENNLNVYKMILFPIDCRSTSNVAIFIR